MKDDDKMPGLDSGRTRRHRDVPAPARVLNANTGKQRITIRLDASVLAWFRDQAKGGGNYQTLINDALREHIEGASGRLERTLRQVIREELQTTFADGRRSRFSQT